MTRTTASRARTGRERFAGRDDHQRQPPRMRDADQTRGKPRRGRDVGEQHRIAQRRLRVQVTGLELQSTQHGGGQQEAIRSAGQHEAAAAQHVRPGRRLERPDQRRREQRHQPAMQSLRTRRADGGGDRNDQGDHAVGGLRRDRSRRIDHRQQHGEARDRAREQAELQRKHGTEADVVRCFVAARPVRQRCRGAQQHQHTQDPRCHCCYHAASSPPQPEGPLPQRQARSAPRHRPTFEFNVLRIRWPLVRGNM